MTFVWLSKKRSTLEKCHHHKKNAIFYSIFIFGSIRIRISATMDFCLHFSRSTAVDIFVKIFCISKTSFVIAPEVLFINRYIPALSMALAYRKSKKVNEIYLTSLWKFWSVFVKFEISHWHQSNSELEPLLFMTRLFRINGSSFICLISFCNDTVLLISISCSFFIFTWFFFRSSSSFVIVLTVFSSSILIEVSSVRIWYNNVTPLLGEFLDVILTEEVIHLLVVYVALTGDEIYASGSLYKRLATPNTEWIKQLRHSSGDFRMNKALYNRFDNT